MTTITWQPLNDDGNLLFKFLRDFSEIIASGIDENWINIEKKSMYPRLNYSKKRGEKALAELMDNIFKRIGTKYTDDNEVVNVPYNHLDFMCNDYDFRVFIKAYKEHPLLCHDYEIITSAASNEWTAMFSSWPNHITQVKDEVLTDWVKKKLNLSMVLDNAHKDNFELVKNVIKTENFGAYHLLRLTQYILDLYIVKINKE